MIHESVQASFDSGLVKTEAVFKISQSINFRSKIRVDFIKECFHYGSAFFCSSLSVSIRF